MAYEVTPWRNEDEGRIEEMGQFRLILRSEARMRRKSRRRRRRRRRTLILTGFMLA
jgi:hypothetical protein